MFSLYMAEMVQDGRTFQTHRYARYATDVTFQHTNRPSGNLQKMKAFYSGKHKMYATRSRFQSCQMEYRFPAGLIFLVQHPT